MPFSSLSCFMGLAGTTTPIRSPDRRRGGFNIFGIFFLYLKSALTQVLFDRQWIGQMKLIVSGFVDEDELAIHIVIVPNLVGLDRAAGKQAAGGAIEGIALDVARRAKNDVNHAHVRTPPVTHAVEMRIGIIHAGVIF